MIRILAILERELRKFFRSPSLMLTAMVFPLIQLVILGNAFGGKITDARVGVVDYDGGPQALRVHEAFDSVAANVRTFRTRNAYPGLRAVRKPGFLGYQALAG